MAVAEFGASQSKMYDLEFFKWRQRMSAWLPALALPESFRHEPLSGIRPDALLLVWKGWGDKGSTSFPAVDARITQRLGRKLLKPIFWGWITSPSLWLLQMAHLWLGSALFAWGGEDAGCLGTWTCEQHIRYLTSEAFVWKNGLLPSYQMGSVSCRVIQSK